MNAKKTTVNSAVSETKSTAAEAAKAPAKTAKPAAEKKTTAKAAKPAAEKKPAAKTTEKKTTAKTAAKAPAKKTAAKPAAAKKTAAKTAAKKPAAKKAAVVSAETICAKLEKKISKTKAAAVKEKVAVDIEVYGFAEGESSQKMYIEVNEGKAVVSPHSYEAKDFRVAISVENAVAFVDGKLTLKALLESDGFYAEGNIAKAAKLAVIF